MIILDFSYIININAIFLTFLLPYFFHSSLNETGWPVILSGHPANLYITCFTSLSLPSRYTLSRRA